MRTVTLVVLALLVSSTVTADRSRTRRRLVHAGVTTGAGIAYFVVQYGLKDRLTPNGCTWCDPPSVDASIRNALVWRDAKRANFLADVTGYYSAPVLALGSLMLAGRHDGPGRWIDDTLPVFESAVAAGLLHHATKFMLPRERPGKHFGAILVEPASDQNFSFFSGHSSLAFSLAVSAGTVAHLRGYAAEPYLWIGGLGLAVATGYLRIGADAHYASDVAVGAVVGSGLGIAVPLLLHRKVLGEHATLLPTGPTGAGVTLLGRF